MQKLHFSISINAPREKVWETVIGKTTYPQWTESFYKGSYAVGDWSTGSKMLFVAPNADGKLEGMVATVVENSQPEFLSIQHIGMMKDGVEDTESEEVKQWTPAFENYSLTETNGVTEFMVDMDINADFKEEFEALWPKALLKLKELAEEK